MIEPMYPRGLRFSCTRCAKCCALEGGDLYLTAQDVRRLATLHDLSDEAFLLEYCEIVDVGLAQRVSVSARPNGECPFLHDNACTIHQARPLQCRTYPFWSHHVLDEESWYDASLSCPGINRGRRWSRREIDGLIELRELEPLLDVSGEPEESS